jgi:hypothetical protein
MNDDKNGFGDFRRLEHGSNGAHIVLFSILADECNPKNEKGALGAFFMGSGRWCRAVKPRTA